MRSTRPRLFLPADQATDELLKGVFGTSPTVVRFAADRMTATGQSNGRDRQFAGPLVRYPDQRPPKDAA